MSECCVKTKGGLQLTIREKKIDFENSLAIERKKIDLYKGAIFSSGFDYPGRHSRWDIGFVNPALEITGKGRKIKITALNGQGRALMEVICPIIYEHKDLQECESFQTSIVCKLKPIPDFFTEEERSRLPSIFTLIRSLNKLLSSPIDSAKYLGLYGAFGYDLVFQFENSVNILLDRPKRDADFHLYLPLEITVTDRKKEVSTLYSYSILTPLGDTSDFNDNASPISLKKPKGSKNIECDHKPGEFVEKVKTVIEGSKKGDYFEVILSQSFATRFEHKPSELFARLEKINPSPYMFHINLGKEHIVGTSPEIYVRVTGKRVEICPISGTTRRGNSALEDAEKVLELLNSEKEESELTMCTDVERNDMARVCTPGSVKIIGRRELEFYSHLIHTVDHVEGQLKDNLDGLDAFQAHMWACTVTGAPKPAALRAIEEMENSPRRWYAGAVGFISFSGDINTGIALRMASIRDGRVETRAGATLLYGCDPESEERETRTKSEAFLSALTSLKNKEEVRAPLHFESKKEVPKNTRVLLIDYEDSFIHNLASYIEELGPEVITLRHEFAQTWLQKETPSFILLSPGPGLPKSFGIHKLLDIIMEKQIPVFGVCLGYQGIGEYFGAKLVELAKPCHGKKSRVLATNNSPMFDNLPKEFTIGRYHSLHLPRESLPECFKVTALTIEREGNPPVIMAIEHKTKPVAGVQFHPESLMSLENYVGHRILENALTHLLEKKARG